MADMNKSQDANANKLQDFRPAVAQANAAVDAAARRGADAAQQSSQAAGDAMRQGAEATADVTRQATHASAEATRRVSEATADTLRRSTQAVAEGQRQIAGDAAERFEAMSRKLAETARGTSEDVNKLFVLPHAAEGGLRDMQQSLAGLVEGVVQTNVRATQELFRMGNPSALIELQQRFAREYMDALMQGTATLVHAIRRTADETLRPLEEQVAQRKNEQHQRQAAE